VSAVELLAAALPPRAPPEPASDGVCCLLGTHEPCIDRKHAIKPSFTNLDLLRAPDSDHVSVRAWRVLTHSEPPTPQQLAKRMERRKASGTVRKAAMERENFPLVQASWITDGMQVITLDRVAVRAHVLRDGGVPAAQWAGYVTTSQQKHGCLRAPVNHNGSQRWLFEMDVVDCSDRAKVAEWWERLRSTRVAGIPRPVIETLDCSVHLMSKHAALWREFERWARPRYQSPLFRLLTYLLPSEEEIRGKQD